MTIFRKFAKASEDFDAVNQKWAAEIRPIQQEFAAAQKAIEPFKERTALKLQNELCKLAKEGLLSKERRYTLFTELTLLQGTNDKPAPDTFLLESEQEMQEIVDAARKKGLPVVSNDTRSKGRNGAYRVEVSMHVHDREQAPAILLRALAAYADSKGKSDIATSVREAADEVEKLAQEFDAQLSAAAKK